jgi:hypothetical protein
MLKVILTNSAPLSQLFRFSARLAESLGSLAGIYYLVRALDPKGSGRATITLESASSLLQRSPLTIRSYIHNALKTGIFHAIQSEGQGRYYIHYTAEFKLCLQKGIGYGAISRAPLHRISQLKYLAAEATAEAIQKKSLHHAAKQVSKLDDDGLKVPDLDFIFTEAIGSDQSMGRGILGVGKRCLYLDSSLVPVGGKQETIANALGRCRATINRRLSHAYRLKRGIPPIEKKQLAIKSPMPTRALPLIREEALISGDLTEFNQAQRHFVQTVSGRIGLFMAHTNIYNCVDIELTRQKHKRSKLSKAFALKKLKKSETAGTSVS